MTTDVAIRESSDLGLRAQPTLRLALGVKDPAKGGAPKQTDYFVASEGQEGEYAAAARKFHDRYGDKPRAIDVLLPSSLGQALDIRHKAWASAPGAEDGGILRAIGRTNFALEGTHGGRDVLTVFEQDGEVVERDISGADDPLAVSLGLALYTEFRFHIPEVLGVTGWAVVSTKSKKSTDNLYRALMQLYAWFGPLTTELVRPKLVLRRAHARPVVKGKRIKSKFWALDLYVPDTIDEIKERLADRSPLLPLPGTSPLALPAGAPESWEEGVADEAAAEATDVPFVDGEADEDESPFQVPESAKEADE